jgi:hypothetical protein
MSLTPIESKILSLRTVSFTDTTPAFVSGLTLGNSSVNEIETIDTLIATAIKFISHNRNDSIEVYSNSKGVFNTYLTAGSYDILISYVGFQILEIKNIDFQASEVKELKVLLGQMGSSKPKKSISITAIYNLSCDTAFVPTNSNKFYFPSRVFRADSNDIGLAAFTDSWYSKHLFAMREPIFYADKSQNEFYRFTWLRTFHNPIAVRLEKHGETYTLFWKQCDGSGGYDPGKLIIDKQKNIDKATWDEFQNQLNQIDFWNMITNEDDFDLDGSRWILEGKTESQYHVVDRWTPANSTKFYKCCNFLIELTDLKIKEKDKY